MFRNFGNSPSNANGNDNGEQRRRLEERARRFNAREVYPQSAFFTPVNPPNVGNLAQAPLPAIQEVDENNVANTQGYFAPAKAGN
ncbi:hypothetical protein [Legionella jordanis]|uniref:Uncharacterized protein n=1 Tax=Legionella jordanis TaxID=456 RepID=A0A0W0V9C6_9GAMM|nr:hypothetical protein [Legionella jordanis]KTD16716.1 hypothetical protein Ljor_1022 [Legionella jordanis]RMX03754.1 hypothetical protein EAW55_05165 [Legionella jordanis]VEH11815.1 Uncharacterised protein [Legionella jordanis]HAT8712875.1 hypothetical protein [Legionella jordanis]